MRKDLSTETKPFSLISLREDVDQIPLGVTTKLLEEKRRNGDRVEDWDRIVELLQLRGYTHQYFRMPVAPERHKELPLKDGELLYLGSGSEQEVYYDPKIDKVLKFVRTAPVYYAPIPAEERFRDEYGEAYEVRISDLDLLVRFFEKALSLRVAARAFGLSHQNPCIDSLGHYIESPLRYELPFRERYMDSDWKRKYIINASDLVDYINRLNTSVIPDRRFFEIDGNQWDAAYRAENVPYTGRTLAPWDYKQPQPRTPDDRFFDVEAFGYPKNPADISIIDGIKVKLCPTDSSMNERELAYIERQNELLAKLFREELEVMLDYFDSSSS